MGWWKKKCIYKLESHTSIQYPVSIGYNIHVTNERYPLWSIKSVRSHLAAVRMDWFFSGFHFMYYIAVYYFFYLLSVFGFVLKLEERKNRQPSNWSFLSFSFILIRTISPKNDEISYFLSDFLSVGCYKSDKAFCTYGIKFDISMRIEMQSIRKRFALEYEALRFWIFPINRNEL